MNSATITPELNDEVATAKKKTGLKGAALNTRDMHDVDPFTLVTQTDWNARDLEDPANLAHIDWLARNIIEFGVLSPITVRFEDGRIVLVNGHMRHHAIIRARDHYGVTIAKVPAVAERKGSDDVDRLYAQGLLNSGKNNTPIEWANLVKRIYVAGLSGAQSESEVIEEIARKLNFSVAWVNEMLKLAAAPVALKNLISENVISATEAMAQVKEHGPTAATEKITAAVEAEKEKLAEGKLSGKVEGDRPVRITKSKLDAPLGGKAPTKSYTREQARHMVRKFQEIVAVQPSFASIEDAEAALTDIQNIAMTILEELGDLLPEAEA
jgi:ParB-like chromosome segregation protein Spo0J